MIKRRYASSEKGKIIQRMVMMKAVLRLLVGFIVITPLILHLAMKQGFAMPPLPQPPKRDPLPKALNDGCIDTVNPDVYWSTDGTIHNWRTGKELGTTWNAGMLWCSAGGWVFHAENGSSGFLHRAKLGQTTPETLDHPITAVATDGSLRVFSLDQGQIWISDDAGNTWINRQPKTDESITDLAIAAADSHVVYALTTPLIPCPAVPVDHPSACIRTYTIFRSTDLGMTWEQRESIRGSSASIETLESTAASVDSVVVFTISKPPHLHDTRLSTDGARTWTEEIASESKDKISYTQSHEGLIKIVDTKSSYSVALSTDQGATWQDLSMPSTIPRLIPDLPATNLEIVPNAPANMVLLGEQGLWYSLNGGHSWQELARRDEVTSLQAISPAMPLTLIFKQQDGSSVAVDFPQSGTSTTLPVADVKAPNGRYFPETQHNMSPLFLNYWEQHGGLAQFGYPQTEPLLEFNPADGKTYLVQYFERNRFEYHPELAGTPHAVLLGLLGKQLTVERVGEAPFLPFTGDIRPDQLFFPETKHTLGKPFRGYWEQNGGLAMYGYPISEPFQELNPDDGKPYTVQYFERARFEHHPEFNGTKHEVLLGLLGNALLREKGWR